MLIFFLRVNVQLSLLECPASFAAKIFLSSLRYLGSFVEHELTIYM